MYSYHSEQSWWHEVLLDEVAEEQACQGHEYDDEVEDVPGLHEVELPEREDLEEHLSREDDDEEEVGVVQDHGPLRGLVEMVAHHGHLKPKAGSWICWLV